MFCGTIVFSKIKAGITMDKFKGLVLISDVDGTLIDENNEVPKENIEAIEYFRAHGGKFTLATGRIPEALFPVLPGLTLDFPCICHNGCSIYDVNKREYIATVELEKQAKCAAEEIMKISPKSGVEIMTPDGIYVIKKTKATDFHLEFEKITARYKNSFGDVTVPWLKILFAQSDEETGYINEKMMNSSWKEDFTIIRTHRFYFEIFNKNASKGSGLKKLCKEYGIDLKNVISIGDNDNDLSMIEISGIGAATGNAPDYVKEKAQIITKTNSDGAVADLISKL